MHQHDERPGNERPAGRSSRAASRSPPDTGSSRRSPPGRSGGVPRTTLRRVCRSPPNQGARSRNGGTVPADMSMPSCTGGAAHFAGKPIGVGECGPIKLEIFLYCHELPGVSPPDIKSGHTESTRFKQNSSRSSLCVFGGEFDGPWCLFGHTGGCAFSRTIMAGLEGLPPRPCVFDPPGSPV